MFQLVTFKIYAIITVYCFNWLSWKSTRSSHWKVFLEINLIQKTLKIYNWYPLSALKEPAEIDHKKTSSIMEQAWKSTTADIFIKNIFNPFHGTGLFIYFLKYIRKPEVSWCFQGELKETSTMKWVKNHLIFSYLFCYLFK